MAGAPQESRAHTHLNVDTSKNHADMKGTSWRTRQTGLRQARKEMWVSIILWRVTKTPGTGEQQHTSFVPLSAKTVSGVLVRIWAQDFTLQHQLQRPSKTGLHRGARDLPALAQRHCPLHLWLGPGPALVLGVTAMTLHFAFKSCLVAAPSHKAFLMTADRCCCCC